MKLKPVMLYTFHLMALYKLLQERTPEQSISHKRMPTYEEHCEFVKRHPYDAWYLIEDGIHTVGSIYLSRRGEIGIAIFNVHKRKGYGRRALHEVMQWHSGRQILANINPKNEGSIRFFESMGFKPLQVTYHLGID